MEIEAFAKVNLSLRVRACDASGRHPLLSLAQSIDWADHLALHDGEDAFAVTGLPVPGDESNLVWRALEAVRAVAPHPGPAALALDKSIPVAAGLGGGSADAAATLVLASARFDLSAEQRAGIAPGLGADVPFCLVGGTAWMEGYGERLTPIPPLAGFWLVVVVPPFEVSTAAAYRRWDDLGGPEGPAVPGRDLPPGLRPHEPLVNDLVPAARSLAPGLGDWTADLQRRWGRAVLMSGSGPALFGFFPTASEAEEAATAVPGTRGARACLPVPQGWQGPSGTLR
ncbi:MAG: 4-(cytidine 5'-diphospho)-2-C-methyl-D-erythritol kinase [Actinomycetota bacterium]